MQFDCISNIVLEYRSLFSEHRNVTDFKISCISPCRKSIEYIIFSSDVNFLIWYKYLLKTIRNKFTTSHLHALQFLDEKTAIMQCYNFYLILRGECETYISLFRRKLLSISMQTPFPSSMASSFSRFISICSLMTIAYLSSGMHYFLHEHNYRLMVSAINYYSDDILIITFLYLMTGLEFNFKKKIAYPSL